MKEIRVRFGMLIGSSLALLASPTPVLAQLQSGGSSTASVESQEEGRSPILLQPQQTAPQVNQVGRTSRTSVGQVGQRQTRDTALDEMGLRPIARIANRIPNRVQNRLRNRIDRNYNPQANATDPFKDAQAEVRKSSRPR